MLSTREALKQTAVFGVLALAAIAGESFSGQSDGSLSHTLLRSPSPNSPRLSRYSHDRKPGVHDEAVGIDKRHRAGEHGFHIIDDRDLEMVSTA